jgi:hypothetical protein
MIKDVSKVEPAGLGKRDSGLGFREFFEGEYRRLAKALFLVIGDPFEAQSWSADSCGGGDNKRWLQSGGPVIPYLSCMTSRIEG